MFASHKISLVLSSSLLALLVAACDGTGSATGESTEAMASAGPAGDPSARPGRGPGGRGGHGPERLFEKFDTDKDGTIAIADLPEFKRQHVAEADANKDGKLTRDELEQARPMMRDKMRGPMGHKMGGPMGHMGGPDAMFEKFDTDKDGTIALADLPEFKRQHMTLADADKDGKLTKDELQKFHDARQKQIDTNGDGTISDDERAAAHGKFMAERFAEEDKNKDGFLTADELETRRWEHMKAADANGDAKLTKEELQTAFANGTLKPPRDGRGHRGHGPMGRMGPAGR